MELRVEEVKLPEVIAFNYDELKAELTEKVKTYETMVYTEKQIKEADNKRKEAKQIEIGSLFVCQEFPSWVRLPMIFDESWLNAGTSMKQIEDNLIGWKNRIEAELATLASLPDFSFEATEVYKQTLDLNKAIAEGRRLADIQKRKQEAEARAKEEAAKKEAEEAAAKAKEEEEAKQAEAEEPAEAEERHLDASQYMTPPQ